MGKVGRPQEIDVSKVLRLRRLGYTLTQIAEKMSFSRQGISKALKKVKDKGEIGVAI